MVKFISIFFITFSTQAGFTDFKGQLMKNFSYVNKIEYNREILDKPLNFPLGTWHKILRGGVFCLFYKTPYKENLGKIRISRDCENVYSNKIEGELEGIKNFTVQSFPFKTVLYFEREKQYKWEIPHFNVEKNKKYQRYDSPVKRMGVVMGSWIIPEQKLVGNIEDNYKDGTAISCHQVDGQCRNIKQYSCDKCRFGWYEVVDFKCPQGSSKYCGQSRCGERGHPACPRGFEVNKVEAQSCIENWQAGFCDRGLDSYCDSNGVLVCR